MSAVFLAKSSLKYIEPGELAAQTKLAAGLWSRAPAHVRGYCYRSSAKETLLSAFLADRELRGRLSKLSTQTGLSRPQVQQWFNNMRKRH